MAVIEPYRLTQTGAEVQQDLNDIEALAPATTEQAGLMSASDKQKLDGIEPSSIATKTELANKVDKVQGKGLSTNDYDDTEKGKVASAYQKPITGIPKTDLASTVQTSLGKADTSAQIVGTYTVPAGKVLKGQVTSSNYKGQVLLVIGAITYPDDILSLSMYADGENLFDAIDLTGATDYLYKVNGKAELYQDGSYFAIRAGSNQITVTVVDLTGSTYYLSVEDWDSEHWTEQGYDPTPIPRLYVKPFTGIPASDLASGVIPDVQFVPGTGTGSAVLKGAGLEANNPNEVAVGRNNFSGTDNTDADKTIFSVGVGLNGDFRNNAIVVKRNGRVYLKNAGYTVDAGDEQLACDLAKAVRQGYFGRTNLNTGTFELVQVGGETVAVIPFLEDETVVVGFEPDGLSPYVFSTQGYPIRLYSAQGVYQDFDISGKQVLFATYNWTTHYWEDPLVIGNPNADWNAASGTDGYIKNKPTIPSVTGKMDKPVATTGTMWLSIVPDFGHVYLLQRFSEGTPSFIFLQSMELGLQAFKLGASDGLDELKVDANGLYIKCVVDGYGQSDVIVTDLTSGEQIELDTNVPGVGATALAIQAYQPLIDSTHKLDYSLLSNTPTIPAAQIQSDWNQSDNTAKDFIKNKPSIPAAQVNSDWNANSGVAQILNKPSIPDAVEANPTIPSGTTQTDLTGLKVGSNYYAVPEAPSNLSDLDDVDDTAPTDGQVLAWDSSASKWAPEDPAGGGDDEATEVTAAALCDLEDRMFEKKNLVDQYNTYVAGSHEKAGTHYALWKLYKDFLQNEEIIATAFCQLNAIGALASAVAPRYDRGTRTFAVDDCCMYENEFYRCITAVPTPEPFDPTKWVKTSLFEEMVRRINAI